MHSQALHVFFAHLVSQLAYTTMVSRDRIARIGRRQTAVPGEASKEGGVLSYCLASRICKVVECKRQRLVVECFHKPLESLAVRGASVLDLGLDLFVDLRLKSATIIVHLRTSCSSEPLSGGSSPSDGNPSSDCEASLGSDSPSDSGEASLESSRRASSAAVARDLFRWC